MTGDHHHDHDHPEWISADVLVTRDREICHSCRREFSWDDPDAEEWNEARVAGMVAWLTCPGCQTPEDHAEATVNTVGEGGRPAQAAGNNTRNASS